MRKLIVPLAVLLLLVMGCSTADLLQRQEALTPPPTRVLAPTFTPTPDTVQAIVIITPPAGNTPGVIIIPEGMDPSAFIVPPPTSTATPDPNAIIPPQSPLASPSAGEAPGASVPMTPATPTPEPPTDTPTPTFTPLPTDTPTPTTTPTPFIVLDAGFTALRTGPSVEYPLVAQLGPNIPITIVGRNTEGTWLRLCCVNGETVWVSAASVRLVNDISAVELFNAVEPPPSPTWTSTPTDTPTVTPTATATPYPFELAIGPQFFPTNNEFLTIWAKLFIGTPPSEVPAEGYFLKVLYQGFDRPGTNVTLPSAGKFELSSPPGSGNSVQYNLKYEFTPPDPKSLDPNSTQTRADLLGTGTWTIYVADGAGNQLSNPVTFTTAPSNVNREVYVGWARTR